MAECNLRSNPKFPHGSYDFFSVGKTPLHSFLGMAQQHSSHTAVSLPQGGLGQAWVAGALSLHTEG